MESIPNALHPVQLAVCHAKQEPLPPTSRDRRCEGVSHKIRKCVSLARRTLSRSTFVASSAVFVNIGNRSSFCTVPFAREVRGEPQPSQPSERALLALIKCLTTRLGGPRFRWFRDRFVAQLCFGSHPIVNVTVRERMPTSVYEIWITCRLLRQ